MRDIAIGDRLSAATIQVKAGDEIRWTNKRLRPVRISLLDYVLDKLSCRSNFSGHFYSGAEARLQPNESAGLCFDKPGTIHYVVRMQSDLRNEEIAESGQVQVEALPGQPNAQNESVAGAPR